MPALYIIRYLLEAHDRLDYGADSDGSVQANLIRASQRAEGLARIYADPGTTEGADEEKAEQIADLARRIKDGPLADAYKLTEQIEAFVQEAAALLDPKVESS